MSKLLQLQETNETLLREQETLMNRAAELVDGKEKGFTDADETRFDQITKERKALVDKIEKEKEFESVRAQIAIQKGAQEAPKTFTIGKKEEDFSISKAVGAAISRNWDKAGKEREIMSQDPKWTENRVIINPEQRAVSVAGTATEGAELVGTNLQPNKFIDVLFNASILGQLPVARNTGLNGNYSVPSNTGKPTATMVGEVAALPAAEKLTTAIQVASPKEMVTVSAFSRMLNLQSTPQIESIIRRHVVGAIGEKLDEMFIGGTGVSPILKGILNKTSGTGAAAIAGAYDGTTAGVNGGAPTYAQIVTLMSELGKKNVGGDLRFVANTQTIATLMTTLKDAANTASGYIMSDMMASLLGYQVVRSQAVPGAYAKGTGTNLSPLILGKFDETEVYQWDNIAIEFDPYTSAGNSQIVVRSYSFWDFLHLRPANYAVLQNIITV